jgi:hypothetical protein
MDFSFGNVPGSTPPLFGGLPAFLAVAAAGAGGGNGSGGNGTGGGLFGRAEEAASGGNNSGGGSAGSGGASIFGGGGFPFGAASAPKPSLFDPPPPTAGSSAASSSSASRIPRSPYAWPPILSPPLALPSAPRFAPGTTLKEARGAIAELAVLLAGGQHGGALGHRVLRAVDKRAASSLDKGASFLEGEWRLIGAQLSQGDWRAALRVLLELAAGVPAGSNAERMAVVALQGLSAP